MHDVSDKAHLAGKHAEEAAEAAVHAAETATKNIPKWIAGKVEPYAPTAAKVIHITEFTRIRGTKC